MITVEGESRLALPGPYEAVLVQRYPVHHEIARATVDRLDVVVFPVPHTEACDGRCTWTGRGARGVCQQFAAHGVLVNDTVLWHITEQVLLAGDTLEFTFPLR